jgi:N-acetylmuramoyl-L-alanine amidase
MGEARGEPYEGKVAVGRCIINRWQSRKWFAAATIEATAQVPLQFSCWNRSNPNRVKILDASYDEAALRNCMRAAIDALDGKGPEWLTGCTHYHADYIDCPNWAQGRMPAGRIGRHLFFKEID